MGQAKKRKKKPLNSWQVLKFEVNRDKRTDVLAFRTKWMQKRAKCSNFHLFFFFFGVVYLLCCLRVCVCVFMWSLRKDFFSPKYWIVARSSAEWKDIEKHRQSSFTAHDHLEHERSHKHTQQTKAGHQFWVKNKAHITEHTHIRLHWIKPDERSKCPVCGNKQETVTYHLLEGPALTDLP